MPLSEQERVELREKLAGKRDDLLLIRNEAAENQESYEDYKKYDAAKDAEQHLLDINIGLTSDEELDTLISHLNEVESSSPEEIRSKVETYYDELGKLGLASKAEIADYKQAFEANLKVYNNSEPGDLKKFQTYAEGLRDNMGVKFAKRTLLGAEGEPFNGNYLGSHYAVPEGQKVLFSDSVRAYFFDESEDVKFGAAPNGETYLDDNNNPYLIKNDQEVAQDNEGNRYLLNKGQNLDTLSPEQKTEAAEALIANQITNDVAKREGYFKALDYYSGPSELVEQYLDNDKDQTIKRDFGVMRGVKNLGASAVLGAKQVGQAGLKGAAKGVGRLAVAPGAIGIGAVAGVGGAVEGMIKGAYSGAKDGFKNGGVIGATFGVPIGMVTGVFKGAGHRFSQVMEGTDKLMSDKVESRYMNYGTITGAYDDVVKAQDSLEAAKKSELEAEAQLIALEEELIGCGPNDGDLKDKLEGLIEDKKIVKGEATAERMAQEVNVDKAEKHFRTFDLKDSNKAKVVKGKDPEATERAQKYFATSTSVSASQRLKSRLSSDDPSAKNKVNLYSARVKLREAVKNHKKAQTEVSLAKENLRRAIGGPMQHDPSVISNAKADLQAAQGLEVKAKGDVSSAAKKVSQARLKVKGIEPAASKPAAKKGARSISSRLGFGKKAKVAPPPPTPLVQAQKQVVGAKKQVVDKIQAQVYREINKVKEAQTKELDDKILAIKGNMGPATKLAIAKHCRDVAKVTGSNFEAIKFGLVEQAGSNYEAAEHTFHMVEKEFKDAKGNIEDKDTQQAKEFEEAFKSSYKVINGYDTAMQELEKEKAVLNEEESYLHTLVKLESNGYDPVVLNTVEPVALVALDDKEKELLEANKDPDQKQILEERRKELNGKVLTASNKRQSIEEKLGVLRGKLSKLRGDLDGKKANFLEAQKELTKKENVLKEKQHKADPKIANGQDAVKDEAQNEVNVALEDVSIAQIKVNAALNEVKQETVPYAEALDNELVANKEYIEAFNEEQAAIDDYNAEVEVQLANADEANIRQAMAQKKTADEARVNQEKQAEATAKKQQAEEQQRAQKQGNQDIIKNIPKGAAKDAVTKIATSEANNGFKAKESKHKGGASYSIDASASTKEGKRVSIKDAISVDLKQDGTGNISINAETWQNARSNPAQLDALREGFVSHTLKLAEDQGWDEVDLKTTGPNAIPKDQIDRIVEDMQKDGLAITVDGKAHKPAVLNKPSVEGKKSPEAPTNKGTPKQKAPESEAPKTNKEKFKEKVAERAQEIINRPENSVGEGAKVPKVSMLQAIKQAANEKLQEMQGPKDNQNPNRPGIEQGLLREQNGDTIQLDDRDMVGIAAMVKQDSGEPSELPKEGVQVQAAADAINIDINLADKGELSTAERVVDTVLAAGEEEAIEQQVEDNVFRSAV